MKTRALLLILALVSIAAHAAGPIEADLLIVGGDESGCAAAVQAARLGVKRIVLVNDIQWLGGQFCTQGIGPFDEWTLVSGRTTGFPRSGPFLEIVDRVRAHNRQVYGVAAPGNSWCGSDTIEPAAAALIFEEWLAPYGEKGSGQILLLRPWEPVEVSVEGGRVTGVRLARPNAPTETLEVKAALTIDSTDWGDVIRLSGTRYMAGPDLKSRFGEPSAPEKLEADGRQEMNPISWCPLLREVSRSHTIEKPARYDVHTFSSMKSVPAWVEWDGSGGMYNSAGWSVYTHRRMVDRAHFGFAPGTEATVLNWPAQDYPLCNLPRHVVEALEKSEPGASRKNIVDLAPAQRRIIYEDVKQHALEFLYYLQTTAPPGSERSFRTMRLPDDYGTADRLPPKPYIREGLRLEALYIMREQDVRTEAHEPRWAKSMVPDGVFGWQFNMDFHPTRRKFVNDDPTQPWTGQHAGARNWSAHTDRAMFPLRGLVPVQMDGLLGASKNIGVTSMVQSALRLHGQMMHVGTAAGTVAALALRDSVAPREVAASMKRVREVQLRLVRGVGGHGTLLWPWHDLQPEDEFFEAANMLTLAGIWRADRESLFFLPNQSVTRREVASALARLCRALPGAKEWPALAETARYSDVPEADPDRPFIEAMIAWGDFGAQQPTFNPSGPLDGAGLRRWLTALHLPASPSLTAKGAATRPLNRAELVDALYRILRERGEWLPEEKTWSQADDPLPFDSDNDNVPDRLQPPG